MLEFFIELTINAITLGSLYVLVALGYVLVYTVMRIFHLAHGDVVVFGGMIGIGVLKLLGDFTSNQLPIGLALFIAIFVSACAGAIITWLIEIGVYRRIRTGSRLTPLLAALGLSMIIQNLLLLATSKDPIPFPREFIPQGFIMIGGVRLLYVSIIIIGSAFVLLAIVALFIRGTRIGTAMLAVAQDPEAAQIIGIPVQRDTAAGFLIAGALAGAAGVLFGMYIGSLAWWIGIGFGIKGFSAALIGGLNSIPAAGIGAIILAIGEIFGVGLSIGPFQLDPSWRDAVAFLLVVFILLFRPQGLLSTAIASWRIRN
jgi:branched-chain amino acid transport system permease protein